MTNGASVTTAIAMMRGVAITAIRIGQFRATVKG
jgi:hypothetical protein